MKNPPALISAGLDGYFMLILLQKSGFISVKLVSAYFLEKSYSIQYNKINYTKKGVEFL